jgi:hypothetical protein
MLKVYGRMIEVLGILEGVLAQIERHDRDLGNQLRRAARETGACLDVALALGYVENVERELLATVGEVQAMLVGLVR